MAERFYLSGIPEKVEVRKMRRKLKSRFATTCEPPRNRALLNGEPLPTRFVSKNELEATIPPEAIPKAGTYIVTLKCEGESFPESHRAYLVVGFKP